jgi:hypothetical protein
MHYPVPTLPSGRSHQKQHPRVKGTEVTLGVNEAFLSFFNIAKQVHTSYRECKDDQTE